MIFKFFGECLPGSDSLCGFPSFLLFNAAFLQKLVIDETLNTNVGFWNISHIGTRLEIILFKNTKSGGEKRDSI